MRFPQLKRERQLKTASWQIYDEESRLIIEYDTGSNEDVHLLSNLQKDKHGRLLWLHTVDEKRAAYLFRRYKAQNVRAESIRRKSLEEIQEIIEEELGV